MTLKYSTHFCLDNLCTTHTWLFQWIRRGACFSNIWKNILEICTLWLNSLIVLCYIILIVATLWSNYYHPTYKLKHRVIKWFVQGHTAKKGRTEIYTETDSNLKYHKKPSVLSFQCRLIVKADCVISHSLVVWLWKAWHLNSWCENSYFWYPKRYFSTWTQSCICAQWGRINDDINWKHHWLWNQLPFKPQGYWVNGLILEGCVSFLESWERKLNINPVHIYNAQFIATCRLDQMVETFFHSSRLFYVGWPTYHRSFNCLMWSK